MGNKKSMLILFPKTGIGLDYLLKTRSNLKWVEVKLEPSTGTTSIP